MCSGAALARREISVALVTTLTRFPRLALAPGYDLEWHTDLGLRAMKRLMVVSH
jgi:cytochrome P450